MVDERRSYNVGATKIPAAHRDIAHAVLGEDDDRGFINIIGAADVPENEPGGDGPHDHTLPIGADVCYRVDLTDEEADRFRAASNCRYVELDGQAHASAGVVGAPSTTTLAYMRATFVRAQAQWHGRDVTVAICDGGTTTAVRTAMNWTLVGRQDFSADLVGSDEITNQHGCLVAPCGVPYGGRILDVIIAENGGSADFSRSAQGIRWAADQGAKVVNYSYAADTLSAPPSVLADAAQYLLDRGAHWFISAGNESKNQLDSPASLSRTFLNVHSSIAFDENTDARASFSNYHVDGSGCAPGANVLGMQPTGDIVTWNGTSASSPHMAQLCARGMTAGRYTANQVAAALRANTRNTGQTSQQQGHGAWSLEAALTALGAFSTRLVAPAEKNLCPNPSVEANTTGYATAARSGITTTNPGRANSPHPAISGGSFGFANVTGDGSTSAGSDVEVALPACAVTAGQTYTFQAEVRHSIIGAKLAWYVAWKNSAGAAVGTASQGAKQSLWVTEWVRYWHTATAPTGAVTAEPRFMLTSITDTSARSFKWDAVRYSQASSPGDYFDGATAGASWDGVASNSTSTLDAVTAPTTTPVTPTTPVPASLPPIPQVTDGIVVTAADLNGIRDAYKNLYSITMGGFRDHRSGVRVTIASGQTVTSGGNVLLSFGSEQFDTDNMWGSGNPTQIVCALDGLYQVGASVALTSSGATAGAQATLRITKNSTATTGAIARGTGAYGSGSGSGATATALVPLVAGDILRCYISQNSGSTCGTDTAFGGGRAYAYWVGPTPSAVDAPAAPPTPPVITEPPPSSSTEAASLLGWGAVIDGDEFNTGTQPGGKWGMYNGPGHGGNGLRRPSAWSISGGILTCTGDNVSGGTTGGMAFQSGRMYCRVEIRMRTYSINAGAGGNRYHPVALLWPDSEQWPEGGEHDFFETDCDSGELGWFMHYPASTVIQEGGSIAKDIQNWHNYGYEWGPGGFRAWCDGVQYFQYTQASMQPPGPMSLRLQLDNFDGTNMNPARMEFDWVRFYTPPG
jgi:hypothetical protein